MKSLATEDYEMWKIKLFGSGFLEKASKMIEVNRTTAKVSPTENPVPKRKGTPNKG